MNKVSISILFLLPVVKLTIALAINDSHQYNKIFYNPITKRYITGNLEKVDKSINTSAEFSQKYSFPGPSCSCDQLVCSCCIIINDGLVFKNNTVCPQIKFIPSEFSAEISILVDGESKFTATIPVNNPPPVCIPVPNVPLLNVCLRLKDLQIHDLILHACVDVEFQRKNLGATGERTRVRWAGTKETHALRNSAVLISDIRINA
ncbi:uncharacterized protein LOC127288066 isoform X2 [Leptopilina boulardi]|uniref:uncharacterized protein LOC127288066 isoform X2 n=1 Tax=Leptopilina boulardi TaxID=63433 RepID=UPI0021F577F3|nr:uncharacterized protein LOC127288066 isoform X2 [Leptopilina boulardi]